MDGGKRVVNRVRFLMLSGWRLMGESKSRFALSKEEWRQWRWRSHAWRCLSRQARLLGICQIIIIKKRWLQIRAGIQKDGPSALSWGEGLSSKAGGLCWAWQCSLLWTILMGFTCSFVVSTLTLNMLSNKTLFVVQNNLLICVPVKDFPSTWQNNNRQPLKCYPIRSKQH